MDKRRVNVRAVVWRDGKLLAVKQKHSDGKPTEYWAIPGGGLDPGESLHDGLVREIMEETGVKAKVGKLLFIQQFPSGRADYDEELEFFFHVENSEDFDHIDLSGTTHGLAEIAQIDFINPSGQYILPSLFAQLPFADYVTGDKPLYIHNELN